MTIGPEIFAWTGEDGLIKGSPVDIRRLSREWDRGSGGAPLGGDFDLDLHLGLVQRSDDQKRRSRANLAQHLAADREMGVRLAGVGEVICRANNIGHRKAG